MMAKATTNTPRAHDHPPYKQMIVNAIDSLKDRKGSSKTAIAKYIASKYTDLPPTHDALLATHLRRLKHKGIVQMIKHSYKLAGLNDAYAGPKKLKLDNAALANTEKRKPGRSKKVLGETKRMPGRPRKELAPVAELILPRNLKAKLKPVRPKKVNPADVAAPGEKRKPGRPKKVLGAVGNGGGSHSVAAKRRGRPPKEGRPALAEKTGSKVKRSVGRPRKNVKA